MNFKLEAKSYFLEEEEMTSNFKKLHHILFLKIILVKFVFEHQLPNVKKQVKSTNYIKLCHIYHIFFRHQNLPIANY